MTNIARIMIFACLLAGCTDAPRECGGQSLDSLRATITTPYEVIEADLPRTVRGQTYRLGDGPAIVLINRDMNRISRDGALAHELGCHVANMVSHPAKAAPSNVQKPDRGAMWDRAKMGAP